MNYLYHLVGLGMYFLYIKFELISLPTQNQLNDEL